MTIRMTGMVSGLDTDSLVKAQMQREQTKLDTLKQNKQTVEWQRDAYKEINAKILDFRNNKVSDFRKDSVVRARTTTTSGDTSAITATANGGAAIGTMSVKVLSLASATTITSAGSIVKAGQKVDTTATLTSQKDKLAGITGTDSTNAGTGTTTSAALSDKYTFKINGTSITVDTTKDSLDDVISRINKQTNVNAYYDSTTGQVSLSSKDTGASSKIDITGDTQFFTSVLQTAVTTASKFTAGKDANVVINGIETTRSSNTFTENGINITINKVSQLSDPTKTNPTAADYVASTITVKPDVDNVVKSITDFIGQYNDLLKALSDKTDETKYRDYKPLTDEQMEAMNETQINDWNTRAKSGLLRGDSILTAAYNKMRYTASSIFSTDSTKYKSLASIGITPGDYTEKGKLYIDEDKLKAAIEADPDAVADIFNKNTSSSSEDGLATRLYDDLYNTMKDLTTRAGTSAYSSTTLKNDSTLGKMLDSLDDQIDDQSDRMSDMEDQLYLKYANMESILNKLQSQTSSLSNLNF